jgi:hypothetical protein
MSKTPHEQHPLLTNSFGELEKDTGMEAADSKTGRPYSGLEVPCKEAQTGWHPRLLPSVSVEAKECLDTTITNYRFKKKNALEYRETWIEGLASARAETGNLSAAQEMQNMLMQERQRSNAHQVKFALLSRERRGLHSIKIQSSEGHWQELSTQREIKQALFKELAT